MDGHDPEVTVYLPGLRHPHLLTATTGVPSIQWEMSIREEAGIAWIRWHHAGERPGRGLHLLALGDGAFAPGWYSGAGTAEVVPGQTLRFTGETTDRRRVSSFTSRTTRKPWYSDSSVRTCERHGIPSVPEP